MYLSISDINTIITLKYNYIHNYKKYIIYYFVVLIFSLIKKRN